MKLEKLEKNKRKKVVIGVVIFLCFIFTIIYAGSRAKYKATQSIPLVNGTINYEIGDFNIVAMYTNEDGTNYTEVDKMPENGYAINEEKSYCKVNGEKDPNAKLYTNSDGEHIVGNLQKNSKCYIYFDVKKDPKTAILAKRTKVARGEITAPLKTNGNTVYYEAEDDDGLSQYLAGNVTNNWLQFAGFYWRIIRINGDGSIRIIYNGSTTDQTGKTTQIGEKAYNSSSNDNAYVGYMYGTVGSTTYAATHANINNSTILGTTSDTTTLLGWYKANIVDKGYSGKVSTEAGFCNDRKIGTTAMSGYGTLGYGTNATVYAPTNRTLNASWIWLTTQTPTFKCNQAEANLFTATGSSKGNKKLTYPVGLITMDEVIYAGGFGGNANSSYYLYTKQEYWTMSPSRMNEGECASVYYVDPTGKLYNGNFLNNRVGVRPVINLSSDVVLTGSGTTSDPYKIV